MAHITSWSAHVDHLVGGAGWRPRAALLVLLTLGAAGCGAPRDKTGPPGPDSPSAALPTAAESVAPVADLGGDGGMASEAEDDGGEAPGPDVAEGATSAPALDQGPREPSPSPVSSTVLSVAPAANPGPLRLSRLTAPGCCVQPFWSADSGSVLFIDKPSATAPVGIWSIGLDAPGAPPQLAVDGVANYAAGLTYRIDVNESTTAITRRADGARWTVPADGRPISISPSATRIAWQVSPPPSTPEERRTSRVWTANLDGSGAREVAAIPRGALDGWLTDDALLLRGRERLDADQDVLWVLSLATGERREIARAERMRGELIAPGGKWVTYYVAQTADPAANGLWMASSDGAAPRRLDGSLFGAYHWRDGSRLVLVPLRMGETSHELIEVDASSLAARRLTDPAVTPFKIANGDWTVSPDGQHVAFVETRDKAIWVLDLPQ